MEEETKSFWTMKTSELTVVDSMKMSFISSIAVIGGPLLIGIGYSHGKDAVVKIKEICKNRRKNKLNLVS